MVTEVALKACQLSVTLWPLLIVVVLAEKVIVGATFFEELAQEEQPQIAAIRAAPVTHRTI